VDNQTAPSPGSIELSLISLEQVWLTAELDSEGRVLLAIDSDAALTRGLAAVVVRSLSGLTPAELLDVDFELFQVCPQTPACLLGLAP